MKISFLDFWEYPIPFNPVNNFLYYLFQSIIENVVIVEPSNADVIIYSCFGKEHTNYNHCKKIFFTGENIRPNYTECDYSISFDFDDYGGRNVRIPLWVYYIDWFNVNTYDNPKYLIPVDYLINPNEFSLKPKNKFCSAIYSNNVKNRDNVVKELNKYKKVDCFGKIDGFTKIGYGEEVKMNILSDYKFDICFENSIYPGYYTEKLLQSKISGCVPIYFSDTNVNKDFNNECFLNLTNYESYNDMIGYIKELDINFSLYEKIINQPLFNQPFNLDEIKREVKKIL